MPSRRYVLIFGLVVAGLIALSLLVRPYVVQESWGHADHVEFSGSYSLDDEVSDSLVVVAQTAHLGSDSHITGDAAILGGTVTVDGHIDGDLMLLGGTLILGEGATVDGDLYLFGKNGQINGHVVGDVEASGETLALGEGAILNGNFMACTDDITDGRESVGAIQPCQDKPLTFSIDPFHVPEGASGGTVLALNVLSSLAASLILCGLAALAVTLFPRQISHIEDALRARPRNQMITGVMVFLAMIAVGTATIILLASIPPLGVVLLPFFLILCLLFFGMVLAGMITLSIVFGEWLLKRVSSATWPPLVQAAVGSIVLSLLLHIPALIPFGWFITLLAFAALSVVAVGASLSTRMGTRPLTRRLSV